MYMCAHVCVSARLYGCMYVWVHVCVGVSVSLGVLTSLTVECNCKRCSSLTLLHNLHLARWQLLVDFHGYPVLFNTYLIFTILPLICSCSRFFHYFNTPIGNGDIPNDNCRSESIEDAAHGSLSKRGVAGLCDALECKRFNENDWRMRKHRKPENNGNYEVRSIGLIRSLSLDQFKIKKIPRAISF